MLFAVIGGGVYLWHTYALDADGKLPNAADEIVLQYDVAMAHETKLDDFNSEHPPTMLLYGNGLMLCSDPQASHANSDVSPLQSLRQRQLTSSQIAELVARVRALGFDTVAARSRDPKIVPPAGAATSIQLNTTTGASTATQYVGENEVAAIEQTLVSECSKRYRVV